MIGYVCVVSVNEKETKTKTIANSNIWFWVGHKTLGWHGNIPSKYPNENTLFLVLIWIFNKCSNTYVRFCRWPINNPIKKSQFIPYNLIIQVLFLSSFFSNTISLSIFPFRPFHVHHSFFQFFFSVFLKG